MIVVISEALQRECDTLNKLDAALGDGDHGTGISTAFADAATRVQALDAPRPAQVLREVSSALMNRMGGASGALYGVLFLRMSSAAGAATDLTQADLGRMWRAGAEGVMQRGKAQRTDKTMLDALLPAVEALEAATTLNDAHQRAAEAARKGAESTKDMIARHGRAKFSGERAKGHIDAGAASIALIFETINAYLKPSTSEKSDA